MDKHNKNTDKDVRPSEGQQSNERWDDINLNSGRDEQENTSDNSDEKKGLSATQMDEQRNTSGYGSSQRRSTDIAAGSVGPLDSDLSDLPSQKRRNR